MPQFSDYHDFTVDVSEFLDECDKNDIKEIIGWLKDEEYIKDEDLLDDDSPLSAMEQLFAEDVAKIRRAYLTMSREDMDIINQIAKKY